MSATRGDVSVIVDGRAVLVEEGSSVAAALMGAGAAMSRRSVSGEPRAPLCGMGVCHECRATIDGIPGRRTCLVTVREGMRVETAAGNAAGSSA